LLVCGTRNFDGVDDGGHHGEYVVGKAQCSMKLLNQVSLKVILLLQPSDGGCCSMKISQ
jgi:hypothetical protein